MVSKVSSFVKEQPKKEEKNDPAKAQSDAKSCFAFRVPRKFNSQEFGNLKRYCARLNVVLICYAVYFLASAVIARVTYAFPHYIVSFAWVSVWHLIGVPFGLLFTIYGTRIHFYINLLVNLAVLTGISGYLLVHFVSNRKFMFSQDYCFQISIGTYLAAAILLFLAQMRIAFKMDIFNEQNFQCKLFSSKKSN